MYGMRTRTLWKGHGKRREAAHHRGRPAGLPSGANRPHLLAARGQVSRTPLRLYSNPDFPLVLLRNKSEMQEDQISGKE
jgi:hypothetical protein